MERRDGSYWNRNTARIGRGQARVRRTSPNRCSARVVILARQFSTSPINHKIPIPHPKAITKLAGVRTEQKAYSVEGTAGWRSYAVSRFTCRMSPGRGARGQVRPACIVQIRGTTELSSEGHVDIQKCGHQQVCQYYLHSRSSSQSKAEGYREQDQERHCAKQGVARNVGT